MPQRPSSKRSARTATKAGTKPAPATTRPSFSWPRWKKVTVTGLFATVIVSGAIWGASLKMQREAKAETRKIREADTDEKVHLLEQRRSYLEKQKGEIESKLSDLHARMKARESGLTTR